MVDKASSKKQRNHFDAKEKDIFLSIVRNSKGGKFWSILNNGTSKNQERHDVWLQVTDIFNKATGKHLEFQQVKAMWLRIKEKEKKKRDKEANNREFNKACAMTGGGRGPEMPAPRDGDEIDLDLPGLDPTPTSYNKLTPPGCNKKQYVPNVSTFNKAPAFNPIAGPVFRFPGNPNPVRFSPQFTREETVVSGSRLVDDHDRQFPVSSLTAPTSSSSSEPSLLIEAGPSTATSPLIQPSMNESVLIIDQTGERTTVPALIETPKSSKKGKKPTMNDTATDYYSRMLQIQEDLAKERKKVLKQKQTLLKVKIQNEKLKGERIKKGLSPVFKKSDFVL